MVNACCAYGCTNVQSPISNIRFHRFPHKDPKRLSEWVCALKRKNFKPSTVSTICSEHFQESDYREPVDAYSRMKYLKNTAVPSKFNFPEHLQPKISNRRILIRNTDCPVVENNCNDEVDSPPIPSHKDVATQTTVSGTDTETRFNRMRRTIKILQQRCKRRDARITNVKELINMLRREQLSSQQLEDVLKDKFQNLAGELIANEVENSNLPASRRRYSSEVKRFALTMYFYSPKCYKYLRSILFLPHPSTVWRILCTRHCNAGILTEVLQYLKEKVVDTEYSHLKNVALVFDSMAIRKGIQYDKKNDKYSGYTDLGGFESIKPQELELLPEENVDDDLDGEDAGDLFPGTKIEQLGQMRSCKQTVIRFMTLLQFHIFSIS